MLKCIIVYKIQNFPLMNQEKVDEFINSFMIGLPGSQENPARGWPENLGVLDIKVLSSLLHVFVIAFMARCSALELLVSKPKRSGNKTGRLAGMTDGTSQEIRFKGSRFVSMVQVHSRSLHSPECYQLLYIF